MGRPQVSGQLFDKLRRLIDPIKLPELRRQRNLRQAAHPLSSLFF